MLVSVVGFYSQPVLAQNTVVNQVEVAVNGQSAEEEADAFRVGLRIVLVRYSAGGKPLPQDAVHSAAEDAGSFVQDRSYRVPGAGDAITRQTPLTRRVRDTAQATHLLTIRYSPEAINQLLRSVADVDESEDTTPISAYADSALVWLLIEDGQRSLLVGGDTGRNVLERAREIGGGVNQRLTFPSMDEVDTRALVVDDLIAGRQQKILAASERYREDVVLTGILTRARGRRWSANWSRYQGQTVEDFSSDAASLDQALQQGIRWLARDSLVEPTGAGIPAGLVRRDEGLIAIGAVDSVKDYAGVMSMLGRMQGVSVSLRAVRQDAILVAVSPRSAVNDVAQRMLAENRVVSARGAQAPAGFQADVVLQYAR